MSNLRFCLLALLAVLLLTGRGAAASGPVDVWIDTDPSLGLPFHDADDGFALVQAFHSPGALRIRGVSVSYGNTTLPRASAITRELAARFGAPAGVQPGNVFDGAAGPGDLGRRTAAGAALETALEERPLTYLALGPLTNLAGVLRRRPELAGRLERVIFLGGRRPGERFRVGRWLPYEFHDANFDKDPAAAAVVLRAAVPLTLVSASLAFSEPLLLTPADLRRVGREGGAAGRFLASKAAAWLRLWQGGFALRGGPLFDSLAVLAAARPELLTTVECAVAISPDRERAAPADEAGPARAVAGRERCFLLLLPVSGNGRDGRRARVCTGAAGGAKAAILEALCAGPADVPTR